MGYGDKLLLPDRCENSGRPTHGILILQGPVVYSLLPNGRRNIYSS